MKDDLVERLRTWADMGDFGRKPDPDDFRRQAAARIEKLEAALTVARNRLQMAAVNATASGESDAYDYQDWANEAHAALTSTREGLTGGEESRPCTCHPDERPEPCPRKYALSDCLAKNTDSPPPMGEMG